MKTVEPSRQRNHLMNHQMPNDGRYLVHYAIFRTLMMPNSPLKCIMGHIEQHKENIIEFFSTESRYSNPVHPFHGGSHRKSRSAGIPVRAEELWLTNVDWYGCTLALLVTWYPSKHCSALISSHGFIWPWFSHTAQVVLVLAFDKLHWIASTFARSCTTSVIYYFISRHCLIST